MRKNICCFFIYRMGNLLQRPGARGPPQPDDDTLNAEQRAKFNEELRIRNCEKTTEILQHFKQTFQDTAKNKSKPISLILYSEADIRMDPMNFDKLHKIKSIRNSTIEEHIIPTKIHRLFFSDDPFDDNQDLNIDSISINQGNIEADAARFDGVNYVTNLESACCNDKICTCFFQDGSENTVNLINPNMRSATKTG